MLVTKEIGIDMGHRVPNHKSKCRNLHGHRYQIEVGVDDRLVTTAGDSAEGMVIDFSDLKAIMVEKIDAVYDHSFTMYTEDNLSPVFHAFADGVAWSEWKEEPAMKVNFVPFIPTAENLAKHWFELILAPLLDKGIKLSYVKVWETPSSTATYENN